MIGRLVEGEKILVGSSMGGWIALMLARAAPDRVAGLVGIAAAPDFTERMWEKMTEADRATLARDGVLVRPSNYGDPYRITRGLIEDGRRHLLMGAPIPLRCPVRLLHGQQDADVPWQLALTIAERVASSGSAGDAGEGRRSPVMSRPRDLGAVAPHRRGAAG